MSAPPFRPFRFLRSRLRKAVTGWRKKRDTGPDTYPAVATLIEGRNALHQAFKSFGADLGEISQQAHGLLGQCETLLELAAGNSEGINLFQDSLQVLDQPIAHVDRSLQSLAPMLEQIDRCDHHSKELLNCQLAMVEALAPLQHMIVFFRIEAAQLPPEHQTTFLTVADEIHRLRELIDQTFDENVTRLREARHTVDRVRSQVKRDYAAYTQRMSAKRGQIEHAIESLGQQLSRDRHRDHRICDTARELDRAISNVVSALQYEDILSQRIAHEIQALRAGPPPGIVGPWMHLMQGQIGEVVTSLRDAHRNLDEGVDRIVRITNELGETSLVLRNLDNSTASIDGMVQLLLEAFEEITAISHDNVKLATESHQALQPVSDITENLSSVVVEVSLNIQLIALNAQVRSVQLGDGSGLEVLAARTAEISAELGKLGDRTTAEILALRTVTQGLLDQLDDMRDTGEGHLNDLRSQGTTIVERLHRMRDLTLTTFEAVHQELDDVRSRTHTKPERMAELDEAETQFQRTVHWLGRHATTDLLTAQERELLATHSAGYTMEAQRQVHAQLTGDQTALGEHDDGLELFIDLPPEPTAAAPVPPPAKPAPARPASPASSPAQTAVLAPVTDALIEADNVELF